MAQFRKQPVVIDAVLFDGNLVGEPSAADPKVVQPGTCPDWFNPITPVVSGAAGAEVDALANGAWFSTVGTKSIFLKTREGVMEASPGDWIIRGVKGELYPCKPDIFAMTYKPLTTQIVWVGVSLPLTKPTDKRRVPLAFDRTAFWAKEDAVANPNGDERLACVPVEIPNDLVAS